MKKRTLLLFGLILLLAALSLAACGGAKQTVQPTEAPAATTAPTNTPVPPTPTEAPQATTAPTKAPEAAGQGDPVKGEELFKAQTLHGNPGCATCHSLKPGEKLVGPSMAGIATDAAGDAKAEGISTEDMLKEMICDPNAEIAGGFPKDVMPQDWCEKLTSQELNDIIAFLMTLKEEGSEAPADFNALLDKAMDAAKEGDADGTKDALTEALNAAESDADKAFVNELLDDVAKGDLDEVAEDIETYLGAAGAPTFESLLDKAMDAAKADDADKTKEELTEALDLAESDADKAFVNELLDDVAKGDLDEVAEDIETYLGQPPEKSSVSESEAKEAQQMYVKQGCFACHGQHMEGNIGPIIAGMPVGEVKHAVRNGFPEEETPMPAFTEEQISDKDLDILAAYINSLTIEDTGLNIPEETIKHLEMAWDALQAKDTAGVEKHLQMAYDATPEEGFEGLRVSIHDMLEDLEEGDLEGVEIHLAILLGK